jgi:hypothetical protein
MTLSVTAVFTKDTQHNGTQYRETEHIDTHQRSTLYNDTWHKDTALHLT